MTAQLNLFAPIADVVPSKDRDAYGCAFHEANPHIMELLAVLSRRARARIGGKRIGFRMVWETARWLYVRHTNDAGAFRLNNNLQGWYARELMRRYPELADIFETRDRQKGRAA